MYKKKTVTPAQQRLAKQWLYANRRKLKRRGLDNTLKDIKDFNERYDLNLSYGKYIAIRDYGGY